MMNPRSLRFQLLGRSLLILAVLFVCVGVLQYVFMKNFLFRNEADTMLSEHRGVPKDLLEQIGLANGVPVGNKQSRMGGKPEQRGPIFILENTSYAFIDREANFADITGNNEGALSPQLSKSEYDRLLTQSSIHNSSQAYRVVNDAEGNEQIVVFTFHGRPDQLIGIIQIGKPTAPLKSVVLQQLLLYMALSIGALAAGLALYLPILRRTLNPLQQIIRKVERTDVGNLGERLPVNQGQEEIDRLAESFNGMLVRLADSFEAEREAKEQMKRFIADASHELRTPLTSIHGFIEVLLRGSSTKPEQLETALTSMLGESTRMKKLLSDLLLLARLDRAPELQLRQTVLDEVITDMQPHLRMLAGHRIVQFDLTTGLQAMVDTDKLKQVILNMFLNAVQFTDPEHGSIVVTLRTNGEFGFIDITDNGPGIDPIHLPHLFERFYRSDSSRTRKQGGSGLGLSIS